MKVAAYLIVIALALMLLAGCAAGPNELVRTPDAKGSVAGFWRGLWNGFISPFTFIISLFNPQVRMYDVHNNGNLYDLGFLLGACIILGGGAGGASSKGRRR